MGRVGQVEVTSRPLDRAAALDMEICAAFLARMVEKYGHDVLEEMEAEKVSKRQ